MSMQKMDGVAPPASTPCRAHYNRHRVTVNPNSCYAARVTVNPNSCYAARVTVNQNSCYAARVTGAQEVFTVRTKVGQYEYVV
eukprot:1185774-Prorocentrum_minimum.AAC.2